MGAERAAAAATSMRKFRIEHVRQTERWSYLAHDDIKSGYATPSSLKEIFLNLFHLHNETLNVWLHLFSGLIFMTLLISWGTHTTNTPQKAVFEARDVCLADSYSPLIPNSGSSHAHPTCDSWFRYRISDLASKAESKAHELRDFGAHELVDLRARAEHELRDLGVRAEAKIESLAHKAMKSQALDDLRLIGNEVERMVYHGTKSVVPRYPMIVFCLGGTVMLFASAVYHLALGYSKATFDLLCRIDLAGISFMIFGSCYPMVYYIFYCHSTLFVVYESMLAGACGLTLLFCMLPSETMHAVRMYRVAAYVLAGSMAVVPLVHGHYVAPTALQEGIDLVQMTLSGACYLIGVWFYTQGWPEKFYPYKFDLVFSSHQIWHAFVATAAFLHYFVVRRALEWRIATGGVCPA